MATTKPDYVELAAALHKQKFSLSCRGRGCRYCGDLIYWLEKVAAAAFYEGAKEQLASLTSNGLQRFLGKTPDEWLAIERENEHIRGLARQLVQSLEVVIQVSNVLAGLREADASRDRTQSHIEDGA